MQTCTTITNSKNFQGFYSILAKFKDFQGLENEAIFFQGILRIFKDVGTLPALISLLCYGPLFFKMYAGGMGGGFLRQLTNVYYPDMSCKDEAVKQN